MATDTIRRTPKEGLGGPGGYGGAGNPPVSRGGLGGIVPPASRVTAPRHTRPAPRTAGSKARARSPRMPFILLLVGLLGGALISLLVISTTLAQGAFRITTLQEQNANLARQEQALSNQVAQAANPAVIANKAERLGMRPNPRLGFIDLKTGKIVVGKPSASEAAINVPGYTP
jgi:hypothetical protein